MANEEDEIIEDTEEGQQSSQSETLDDVKKVLKIRVSPEELEEGGVPDEYKFIKVKSLDDLKDKVNTIKSQIDEKEEDVYNKLSFPLRLGMLCGAAIFFLVLGISFYSEMSILLVAKRSIGSFFLFCFLGWMFGLIMNYFSGRLGVVNLDEGKGKEIDVSIDDPIESFKNDNEKIEIFEADADEAKLSDAEVTEELKKIAKDEPDKMAQTIKSVMHKE